MTVKQAREAARQWVIEEAIGIPGFCGAYTAGSTNWLPDDAPIARTSDMDIMIVVRDPNQAGIRRKFTYRDILLEVSCLSNDQLARSDLILSDYHLAPSLRTTNILLDPSGNLTALLAIVRRNYAKPHWVAKRCTNARTKVSQYLRSIQEDAPLHDQTMAWLFATGITTHVLLVAGLRNPTVRARYTAVRELLSDYGRVEFHETLLELLGCAQMERARAGQHVAALTNIFDAAREVIRTPFPFASDVSGSARPISIDASLEMIEQGYHREAMFWIAVTHSRCQQVLSRDAPEKMTQRFRASYRELTGDLGVPSFAALQRRCAEVERILPQVWEVAKAIMAANPEIEDD